MLVGVFQNAVYQNREFQLFPGDSLFVYTDGIPEARDTEDEMSGEARLLESLDRDPDGALEEQVDRMRQAINDFVKIAPQFDDITILAFCFNGQGSDA